MGSEILARLNAEYPGEGSRTGGAFICHAFRSRMKPGEIVFVKKGTRCLLGYGIVTGDYEYQANREDMPHLRKVDWKDRGDWPVEAPFALKTLTNVTDYPEFVENRTIPPTRSTTSSKSYSNQTSAGRRGG